MELGTSAAAGRFRKTHEIALLLFLHSGPGVASNTKALARMQGTATRSIQGFFKAHDVSHPSFGLAPVSRRRAEGASSSAVRNPPPKNVSHAWKLTTDSVVGAATSTYNKRLVRTSLRGTEQAKRSPPFEHPARSQR